MKETQQTQPRTSNVEPKTSIIIPAYKEEEGLPIVLEKLFRVIEENPEPRTKTLNVEHRTLNHDMGHRTSDVGRRTYEVIVVDDGSTDRTSEVASQFPCRVVRHKKNLGKGEAIKTGIKNARGENIIWIDADNTYPVELIPQMAEALKTCDMVVGSRRYGRGNIPWFNRIGNWLFRTLIKIIYGFKPFDPCTGLYGAKKFYLEAMKLKSKRFAIEPEISMKGSRMKLKQQEIPISYGNRHGGSKLNSVRVGFEDLWTILKLIFWRP